MEQLIEMIKVHEGVSHHVYKCPAGYETIGVGRNISESGLGLSDEEIDYLLTNDIMRCYKELGIFQWFTHLDENRQFAIVDMCFNLGLTRLLKFENMIKALENKDWDGAAEHALDSKWAIQVGERAQKIAVILRTGEINNG
jgi:lysozyme